MHSATGSALLALAGLLLIYIECNRPGWILPGAAGVASLLSGLRGFMRTDPVHRGTIYAAMAAAIAITIPLCWLALRARRNKFRTHADDLAGTYVRAVDAFHATGEVSARGVRWPAHIHRGCAKRGELLLVTGAENGCLRVEQPRDTLT